MSEILVNTIKKADGTGNLSVPAETGTVVTTASPSLGRRNLIINGAMQVAQRGTSTTGVNTNGYHSVDRMQTLISSLGTWTISQEADAPDGFKYSYKKLCTTPDATPDAGNYMIVYYNMETQDVRHLQYGSSEPKSVTLSFWVKSNKTGNASCNLWQVRDAETNKWSNGAYSINSADTWEYKTITFPGDTVGIPSGNTDNSVFLRIEWFLNSGSTFTGGTKSSSWHNQDNTDRNADNLGVGGATNDYWQITGVQLEVGSVATPFEHRSYGEELALCQRYYYMHVQGNGETITFAANYYSSSTFEAHIPFPVTMRTDPSLDIVAGTDYYRIYRLSGNESTNTFLNGGSHPNIGYIYITGASSTAGTGAHVTTNNASSYIAWDAEL